jgi:hypothetical protein
MTVEWSPMIFQRRGKTPRIQKNRVIIVGLTASVMILGSAVGANVRPRYCVAQRNASEDAVKAAVGWACGQGKVSNIACNQTGAMKCRTVYDRADVVFNVYYKKHQDEQQDGACDFRGAAQLSTGEPNTFFDFKTEAVIPCP